MSLDTVEVHGTLQPDGTLRLDRRPDLPPGRVRVTLQPVAPAPQGDAFWATLRAIWDGQAARGHVPRTTDAIDAERRALREEVDQEIEEAIRLQEESRRLRGQADPAATEGE